MKVIEIYKEVSGLPALFQQHRVHLHISHLMWSALASVDKKR